LRAGGHRQVARFPGVIALPSQAVDSDTWATSYDRLVATLRDLIRIPSVNPPDPPGGELDAARYIAGALEDAGVPAAIHEAVAAHVGARRISPIAVGEKGVTVYRLTFHGAWGHGSMPRPDNALRLAADAVARLAAPMPARLTPVMQAFFDGAIDATDGEAQ